MGTAIGTILPLAVGVALSPVPIIAVILMLFSQRARRTGPAFVLGWLLGLALVGGIVLFIASTQNMSAGGTPSTIASVIKLALGALFLFLAFKQWRNRPKPGAEPKLPKWMTVLDAFTPLKALGLGVLLSAGNAKNLSLTISAALEIARAGLRVGQVIGVLAIFVGLASLTVIVPVLFYLVGGARAARVLENWKAWLTANNATVLAVLFLVLGALLVGKGIGELAG
jgi:threonine/homoserine/homoserine lactone efflux protein